MVASASSGFIRTWASYDQETETLFVYLINKRNQPEKIQVVADGRAIESISQAWEYFGTNPEDRFPVWQRKKVRGKKGFLDLKGLSITVIGFELAGNTTNYYFDPVDGDDLNAGTSAEQPFRSLE